MFMLERVLERLSSSNYSRNFILKGGMLISSMMGIMERTTMDMDTTVNGINMDEDEISNITIERFIIDNQEAFSFGALEAFGFGDSHMDEEEIISKETVDQAIDAGVAYRIMLDENKVGGVVVHVREVHFYVNCCGFHIVEFLNGFHRASGSTYDYKITDEDEIDGMFVLRKAVI